MKYFSAVVALVSLVPGIASMTINTPTSVVQCQPQLLSWSDGIAPYYLTIIPGGQPSAAPLKSFDTQSGNSITWLVDIVGGTTVSFSLKDSTGATAYTDMVTIQKNTDSSCLSGSSSNTQPAGNTGPGSAPQAADATSASVTLGAPGSGASSGTTGTSRAVVAASSAATRPVSTPSPVSATAQRTTSPVAAPAGTPSPAGASTSGAKAKANVASLAVIGALGLLGAIVL